MTGHGEEGRSAHADTALRRGRVAGPVNWPVEDVLPRKRDWRDTLRGATDLALVGILTCVGSLALVTTGAAVATASAALHQWCDYDTWPPMSVTLRRYARALLPGIPVSLLAIVGVAMLWLNVAWLATGMVPGGPVLIGLTLALALVLLGYAALTVVEVGRAGGEGWRAASRRAGAAAQTRPAVFAALAGVTALAAGLSVSVIPVAAPIVVGYGLFALHAVARRMLPGPPPA